MISFKQFIVYEQQQILSRKEALKKLGTYIKAAHETVPEWKKHAVQIPTRHALNYTPEYKHLPDHVSDAAYDSSHGKKLSDMAGLKLRRVPLDTVHTDQVNVGARALAQKTKGTFKQKQNPRLPIFIKGKDGRHHLKDGNHRVFMRKMRGMSHVWGLVQDE